MKDSETAKGRLSRKPGGRRARSPNPRNMRGASAGRATSFSILPEPVNLKRMLQTLKPHDHLSLIYESQEEWRAAVVPFISIGLKRGEKCCYFADAHTAEQLHGYLQAEGVDVAFTEASGQLVILCESEAYTKEGSFDPDLMISLLITETEKAIAEGYPALRLTGEMTWVLHGLPGSERLLEYEAKLNRDFYPKYPALGICQYDRWKFDPEIIKGVIMTHPLLVRGNNIYHNFYYIPPEEFLLRKHAETEVQHWLNTVEREQRRKQELRSHVKRLQMLFDEALTPIMVVDEDGKYIDANRAALEFLECKREELLGKIVWDFTPPDLMEKQTREHSPFYAPRIVETEYFVHGKIKTLLLNVVPLTIAGKKILYGIGHDITERKRVEEERRQLEQKAQLASRLASVGEMAAGIAHEINNPLTGVIGYAQLLSGRENIPEDIRRDLEAVNEGAQRVAGIIKRLLTFARQARPERTLVSINDLITNTLDLRAYHLRTSNIKVTAELATDLPITMADPAQLQQVFLNIIANAETMMKLARGKGKLLIKTEKADDIIRISFKDNGPGIAKENLERIFDPFFTTREVGQGTGLGLSICHGIIAEHNGRIWVESEPGKGATFIVELPIVIEARQLEMVEPADEESRKVPKAKILVVDDEPSTLEFLSRILTNEGHEVETVSNAAEALEMIKNKRYSLILLDIKMPGASGIELYRRVQRIALSLAKRVMFITGDIMGADTEAFLSRTKAPYITKPFDVNQLKKRIERFLTGGQ